MADSDTPNSELLKLRFKGLAVYCGAQLETDQAIALKELHEAHDAFAACWLAGSIEVAKFFPTLGLELVQVTNDLMYYDPETARRLPCLQTGLKKSKQAETLLPSLDKNLLAIFIVEMVELHVWAWIHLPKYEEREIEGKRGLELFERLRKEISASDDPRCAVAAFALQLDSEDLLPEGPPIVDTDILRPRVAATKDKLAIGSFLAAALRSRLGPLGAAEDPKVARDLLTLSEKEAVEAFLQLQTFPGIRRFRTSAGYVIWTRADTLAMYGRLHADSPGERLRLANEAVEISYQIRANGPPLNIGAQYSNLGYYLFRVPSSSGTQANA